MLGKMLKAAKCWAAMNFLDVAQEGVGGLEQIKNHDSVVVIFYSRRVGSPSRERDGELNSIELLVCSLLVVSKIVLVYNLYMMCC